MYIKQKTHLILLFEKKKKNSQNVWKVYYCTKKKNVYSARIVLPGKSGDLTEN